MPPTRKTPLLPTPNIPPQNPWFRRTSTPEKTPDSPNTAFYTPQNTPHNSIRNFPPLQPKPQRPVPPPRRRNIQQQKQNQQQQPNHTPEDISILNLTTSTNKDDDLVTLSKADLRDIMGDFLKTIINVFQIKVPERRLNDSLDNMINRVENRTRKNTSISRIEKSFENLLEQIQADTGTKTQISPLKNTTPIKHSKTSHGARQNTK